MIMLNQRQTAATTATATLTLPFETRSRSRFRALLDDGREVGVALPRGGGPLRPGELLWGPEAPVVRVAAAAEAVATVRAAEPGALARCAYHLGNRHVAVQVGPGWLRFAQDHVLEDMVRGLGFEPLRESAPFDPESGAYDGAVHGHGHGHDHSHHAH